MNTHIEIEQLIDDYGRELYRYLWRMVGDNNEVQDCLQDTYIRAMGGLARLNGNANHRAWLYRIATNVSLTHLKRRSRSRQREVFLHPFLAAKDPTPVQIVTEQELLQRVALAIEQLPQKQRAALTLRKYQELSYTEIGAALDCSPEAARANVYQALRKLRTELKDEE